MIYDFNIPPLSIAFFLVAVVCLVYILTVYSSRLAIVRRVRKDCDSQAEVESTVMPHVSVIVYSPSDPKALAENLPPILEQEYTGIFEVIVVNDGNIGDSDIVIRRLKLKYTNLYLTFAPEGTRVLSQKKLSNTIGIKAAKGDIVLLTDATTKVASPKWLSSMMQNFLDPRIKLVLGYNRPNMPTGWGYNTCSFDEAADAVAWISAAAEGRAYRACASNLAFRRQMFFDHKGYSSTLNLNNGDDDLFVYEIADRTNTKVELSTNTIGTTGFERDARRTLKYQRKAHAFTGRDLPKKSRGLMALGEWLMWVLLGASIAGYVVAGVNNGFGISLAILLIAAMYIIVLMAWRSTLTALEANCMPLILPWLAALRPLRNIYVNLRSNARHQANYTWQK